MSESQPETTKQKHKVDLAPSWLWQHLHKSILSYFSAATFPVNPAGLYSCLRIQHVGPRLLNKAVQGSSLLINGSPWKFLLLLLSLFCSASRVLAAFSFFWSSVNGAGSRTHEQLSRDPPPALSGDLPLRGSVYQPSSCRGRFEPS